MSLQNPCFNFKIDFGTAYSEKLSLKSFDLALKIGSLGTAKGIL
jgi:hypothetical protein